MEIEVINAGWPGGWSFSEAKSIKEKWVHFEPDLFLVYDGFNERQRQVENHKMASANNWVERWIKICELGKQNNFDIVIVLQAMIGTGDRTLSLYERNGLQANKERLEYLPPYLEKINELNNQCIIATDFFQIFDNIKEPIYFDAVHTGPRGNEIIAENFYELILPIVTHQTKNIKANYTKNINFEKNMEIISPSSDPYEEVYRSFQNIISPYKTPKVIKLIFE